MKKTKFFWLIPIVLTSFTMSIFLFIILQGPIGSYDSQPATFEQSNQRWASQQLNLHISIIISSNSNFTSDNGVTGGAGTMDSPWIIENWKINAEGVGSCIYIANTTDFFIIRHCSLWEASPETGAGIILQNVTNACIDNNNCYSNGWAGIYLVNANNTILEENWCWDNVDCGIRLAASNNLMLRDNNCTNSEAGFRLYMCNNITLVGNTASNCGWCCISIIESNTTSILTSVCSFGNIGIMLGGSTANAIENNSIRNMNIGIDSSNTEGNTIRGNRVDWSDTAYSGYDFSNAYEENYFQDIRFFINNCRYNGYSGSLIIGPLGYTNITISLVCWGLFLLIKGTLWINQKQILKRTTTKNADLGRLQSEHEAILARLDKEHQ